MTETNSSPLHLPQIVALYVGAVLGCGILILPGITADIAGPGSLISWIVMSLLSLPLALTMGLLSAKFPDEGGVSFFVSLAFNPQIGSLIGWFFLLSTIIGVPVLALTGAGYITAALGFSEVFRIIIAIGIISLGLVLNYIGMKISGQVQIVVVLTTIIILVSSFLGSFDAIVLSQFSPLITHGWMSIGQAATLIFWSFIGWEAVTHITREFEDPKRDVVRATIIASVIISSLYLLTAFAVIGTHCYGPGISDVSLLYLIRNSFGQYGTLFIGIAALFICIAPAITYIGAASRLAHSLSVTGYAPICFSRLSYRYRTPIGGLILLLICFILIIILFSTSILPLSVLLQLPNATFLLTYIGGCAAGIILLKDNRFGIFISGISLVLTVIIFIFISWAVLFPLVITVLWGIFVLKKEYNKK